jgi:hypothetical protein
VNIAICADFDWYVRTQLKVLTNNEYTLSANFSFAAQNDKWKIQRLLLENGADPNHVLALATISPWQHFLTTLVTDQSLSSLTENTGIVVSVLFEYLKWDADRKAVVVLPGGIVGHPMLEVIKLYLDQFTLPDRDDINRRLNIALSSGTKASRLKWLGREKVQSGGEHRSHRVYRWLQRSA